MGAAIRVQNVGKQYRLVRGADQAAYRTFREVLMDAAAAPLRRLRGRRGRVEAEEFWAVRDVSFEVQPGEVVGVIGRNGAGKSTLLKVLSRITKPTTGRAELLGRVGSLLEVGTGFHPELTGRENVYLNGSILGMSRKEIERKFDEIVAFAEVEKFLDTPVKRYSSGMYVRLAFAVAAHLEPEILIVDEVLAVGDAGFQKKCLGKMGEVGRHGRTVLFVSHNMTAVQALCTRAVILHGGRVEADGTVAEVVPKYLSRSATGNEFRRAPAPALPLWVAGVAADVRYDAGRARLHLGTEIRAEVGRRVSVDLRVSDGLGREVGFGPVGSFHRGQEVDVPPGGCRVSSVHDVSHLANGTYFLSVDLANPTVGYHDRVEQCVLFEVSAAPRDGAYRVMEQSWGLGCVELPYLGHSVTAGGG